jgi:threonyl-tRNA synthetase
MPTRFGLGYVGRDNDLHRPAMLHRAILGSLERFIALYTEMTGGDFPLWLAPVQAVVLPIAERHAEYARGVVQRCSEAGIRTEVDERSEKLGFKIREAELHKIPVMLVVGDQEAADSTVTPRWRHGSEPKQGAVGLDALVGQLVQRIDEKRSWRTN